MDARTLARAQAAGRVVLGAGLVFTPQLLTRGWLGRDSRRSGAVVLSAATGARDIALGGGLLAAVQNGSSARPWLLGGLLADTADLIATTRHRDGLPLAGVLSVGAIAAGSAALSLWLQSELD